MEHSHNSKGNTSLVTILLLFDVGIVITFFVLSPDIFNQIKEVLAWLGSAIVAILTFFGIKHKTKTSIFELFTSRTFSRYTYSISLLIIFVTCIYILLNTPFRTLTINMTPEPTSLSEFYMENLNSDAKKVPLSLNTPIKTIMGKYKVFANFRNQSYENIDKIIEIKLFDFIKQETIDLQTPHGEIYVQDLSPQTYTYINSIQVDTHTTRSTPGRYKVISYRNIDSIHAYYEEYSIPVNKGKVTRISSPTKRIVKPGILIKPEVTGRGDYSITSKLYGKVLITVNHDDTMVRLLPGHYIVDKINHDNTTTSIPVLLATPGNIIMLER